MRICFFGDSFVNGVGDSEALGWSGRLTAAALQSGIDLTAYDLGVRRDTSTDILNRWKAEAAARFVPGSECRLLFALGTNDCADDGSGASRVPTEQTLSNIDTILNVATTTAPTLLIGPGPILDDKAADHRIAALEEQMAIVAVRHGVPFLPVFEWCRSDADWTTGAAAGDGTHPDAAGYAAFAAHLLEWLPFLIWTGIDNT